MYYLFYIYFIFMTKLTTIQQGQTIEQWVAEYLIKQRLRILQRNFRCRFGEIDLICLHQKTLVFIEVRFRSPLRLKDSFSSNIGNALTTIDHHKQYRIRQTAEFFLLRRPNFAKLSCRFDAIAVTLKDNEPYLEWIQNAFD